MGQINIHRSNVVTELLDAVSDNKKLDKFAAKLFKIHSRSIRRFCIESDLNYDNYAKKYAKQKS